MRILFRMKFVFLHPIKSLKFVISGESDYSKIDLETINKFVKSPKLIIEAGAADGVDTLRFAKFYPGAQIIGLEPVLEQYTYLRKLCEENGNIKIINIALSKEEGTAKMYLGSSSGELGGLGSSSLLEPEKHHLYFPEIEFSRTQNVETISLDKLIINYNEIDLLWLDIQGKELEVLSTSEEALCNKVRVLHLEISRVPLYVGMPREKEIRLFLQRSGFKCVVDRVGAISGNALYVNTKFC